MKRDTITVIGSYNVGLFLKGHTLPSIGETVICNEFYEGGGGKGSNQAIAAAKMGARTRFVGRVGNDKYGKDAIEMFRKYGVIADLVSVDDNKHTGISVIMVDENGQNLISVAAGANYGLSTDDIDRTLNFIRDSIVVGFKLENSLDIVIYAIRKVHSMGIKTLLDPAPAQKLPDDIYSCINYIKPNEHEAKILTGINVLDVKSAESAGRWFIERGVETAIITLGKNGVVLVKNDTTRHFLCPDVRAIDTTGAGDCFSGAMMAALSTGKTVEESIIFAVCAAAISVTRLGVINSIPDIEEVINLLEEERIKYQ
jgi:ribokinase